MSNVHASVNAMHAPTTYDTNLATTLTAGEGNCATYFDAGLCANRSL
jgi:hypothetical protein